MIPVVGGEHGHAPCKILFLQQIHILYQLNSIKTTRHHKREVNLAILSVGDITVYKTVMFVRLFHP